MKRFSDAKAAKAFADSRLGAAGARAFGTLASGVDTAAIVDRAALRI
jgi:hypothetical protein